MGPGTSVAMVSACAAQIVHKALRQAKTVLLEPMMILEVCHLRSLSVDIFLFMPVLHNWCNKACGLYCPVCGMVHIKNYFAADQVRKAMGSDVMASVLPNHNYTQYTV